MQRRIMLRTLAIFSFGLALLGNSGNALAHGDDHPVHIHAGTCATLGDVVAPLSDVSYNYYVDGVATGGGPFVGQAAAIPAEYSVTTVPMALADIIAGGHSINVHRSAEAIADYIACGDVGGLMAGPSDLTFELGELNGSGYSGHAHLHDNGDGTTMVTVYISLASGVEEETEAHAATPAAAGEPVEVTLTDFKVSEVAGPLKVGVEYTFMVTNDGVAVHEAVLEAAGANDVPLEIDGSEAEIEDLAPGTTGMLTFTFTEAGDYQLSCHVPGHYEAGMVTVFTVEA